MGLKFRRQRPVDEYVADFCCLEKGYQVLRFTNKQVEKNIEGVIARIQQVPTRTLTRPPSAGTLSRRRAREVEAENFPAGEG